MSKDVRIYVGVYVARVGVYAANIKIVTFEGDRVVYDKTLEYPRRSRQSVTRSAYRTARQWCALRGYEEIEWEDADDDGRAETAI